MQNAPSLASTEASLHHWRVEEKTAFELLKVAGELRFDRCVDLVFFRRDLYGVSTATLLKYHQEAIHYQAAPLPVASSLAIAMAIHAMPQLAPCKLDLGKLAVEWQQQQANFDSVPDFVARKLDTFTDAPAKNEAAKDVVLYGFGRIGRLLTRRLIMDTGKGEQLRLRAIVIRPKMADAYAEATKRAALLESDSVHGDFAGVIEVAPDGSALTINGNRVRLIYAQSPEEVNYASYDIKDPLVIDNTGVWRDREGLGQHLQSGGDKVILTAPAKGNIPNVVYGVNHEQLKLAQEDVYSAASCTTNAIAPVLEVLYRTYGIEKGHIETIHAYTNDQNLLDNFHKKPRRGRGAPINMVLTSTGAASAVAKVNPAFAGKLTGNAIRVPTPNVSLAILNLTLEQSTNLETLQDTLRQAAFDSKLAEQIHYSDSTEYVSTNVIGTSTTSVIDAPSTILSADGKSATVYLWYDNEYGYCCQVVRLAKHIAKVRRHVYF